MNKKSRKDIILIITYIGIVVFTLVNFDKIISMIGYVINIFLPFIIGILIAFMLNVLVNFIEKRLLGKIKFGKKGTKFKRPLSITFSLIIVIMIVVLVFYLLIPQLKNSVSLFIDSLPSYKDDVLDILYKFDVQESTVNVISDYFDNFGKAITNYLKDNSGDVITITTEFISKVINIVSKGVISVVFAIYILAQKETLKRQLNKLMNAYLSSEVVSKIMNIATLANTTFSNFVTGQCLEACIFGSLCFIGMLILRIPYAITIAVLLGFTALVPIFGAIIGTFLGAILIFMVSPIKAVIFVIFVLIIQQIENNFIYPKVVGKSVGLPGMWVLVSATVGGSIGGLFGLIIATPLSSLIYALFSHNVNDRLIKKEITGNVDEKTLD